MEYQVLVGEDVPDLVNVVNEFIKEGWQCTGGVCVNTDTGNNEWFYQAMIRDKK